MYPMQDEIVRFRMADQNRSASAIRRVRRIRTAERLATRAALMKRRARAAAVRIS